MGAGRAYDRELVVPIILNYIRDGNTIKDACALAGISRHTFKLWRKENPNLTNLMKKAELEAKNWHIRNIKTHANVDWKASAWYLERKHKGEWGKEQPEVKVRQSVEVTNNTANISIEEVREAATILASLGFSGESKPEEAEK